MRQKITIYTDGGSRGNPGPAGVGAVVKNEKGQTIKELSKFLGTMTNNEAEYEAVILGLLGFKRLVGKKELKNYDIEVKMDSELVSEQLSGNYQIKKSNLFSYFIKVWNMQVNDYPKIKFTHIGRDQNKAADRLANMAMDFG